MQLWVLGSGSRGNAVLVDDGVDALLLDAGFTPRVIERRAAAAGCSLARVRAVVVTHEHSDHAQGALPLARRLSVPVLATRGTWTALSRNGGPSLPWEPLPSLGETAFGSFTIRTSPTSHDAAEPVALAVRARRTGGHIAVAYDLGQPTAAVELLLRGLTCLVVEANHDDVLLRTGPYPAAVRDRIAGSGGHLSNRAAAHVIAGVCHPGLRAVVLAHISDQCNTSERARRAVAPALDRAGFRGELHIAPQDAPLGPIATAP